jgi:hypothetical protein
MFDHRLVLCFEDRLVIPFHQWRQHADADAARRGAVVEMGMHDDRARRHWRNIVRSHGYWAVFALALALSMPVFANTYYFAGTINPVAPSASISIPPGTPFTGTPLSIRLFRTATAQTISIETMISPPELRLGQVHIGSGLYDFSITSVGMEEDHNYGLFFGGGDVIWFWANPTPATTISCTGQAANPIFFDNLSSVLLWSKKPGTILANANTFSVGNIVNIGQWTFAGIDFSTQQGQINGEHYRGALAGTEATTGIAAPSHKMIEVSTETG